MKREVRRLGSALCLGIGAVVAGWTVMFALGALSPKVVPETVHDAVTLAGSLLLLGLMAGLCLYLAASAKRVWARAASRLRR